MSLLSFSKKKKEERGPVDAHKRAVRKSRVVDIHNVHGTDRGGERCRQK
jgi:hypothetical protein